MINKRSYTELSKINSFGDRLEYLKCGKDLDRNLKQRLYSDPRWLQAREIVKTRDMGFDLGVLNQEVEEGKILVHHMNLVTMKQIENDDPELFDPEYLISTSLKTHSKIHYEEKNNHIPREKGDTDLWEPLKK